MKWIVTATKRAKKQIARLPDTAMQNLVALIRDIENNGPVRGDWPNYSFIGRYRHHCHIKKGRPTYVAVWEVVDKEIRLVEVIYAGTHEKAPY
ncbi:MAG: cytotoxic translational repressor of toxin-antitoxin stability system [Deltaproteobacteria bacterium]|nr:cytotoxic translational repressor of toxin-antitoxin stability system [Deltaproteobacteria bacterium]